MRYTNGVKKNTIILLIILVFASFLRLNHLDKVPVSLFGDELDAGYQAYSILKTGKDYTGNFMPIHLQSLAEWRTSLYLYSIVPTVAIFGISPLGVRLPAAIFGVLGVWALYLLVKELVDRVDSKRLTYLPLVAAFLLTISPWHLQYSRAAFEVTEMIFCLLMGLTFFFKSLRLKGKYLWASGVFFMLMPWIYSTAKLFTPLFLLLLFVLYFKDIFRFPKKQLLFAVVSMLLVGVPILYSTLFGGGTARFNYISIFGDPTLEPEIGTARGEDALARGEEGTGLKPTVVDKMFHNKVTYLGNEVLNHALMPFSSEFLFLTGDPNPRHSIDGMGEMYNVEIFALLAGIAFFLFSKDRRIKLFVIGWIVLGVIPSALTTDGGNHATRLILILPPLIILTSLGLVEMWLHTHKLFKPAYIAMVFGAYLLAFSSYQHLYWVHNPFQSERWWHAGWSQAIASMKEVESQYDQVIITTRDEPPWIFFAAWSQYDPNRWHAGYPFKEHTIEGFGKVSYIDKYSFGSPEKLALYDWGKILTPKMLFIASAKEVNVNLIKEPDRTPGDLKLIKAIAYPSGEPVFYLFTKKAK